MRRLILPALLLTLTIPGTLTTVRAEQRPTFVTNQQVTLVMKNGERQSGTLVYHNDANFNLMANGQEKAYPISDVAVVDFGGGSQPSGQELGQLPTSNDPPELQRHMVVLKDGTTVRGKMYTIKETAITFDTEQGQRKDFDISNISRMYVSAPGARQLFASQQSQAQNPVTGTTGMSGAIVVNAAQGWADTGRTVRRNQRVTFETTGEIKFGSGPDQVASAGGKGGDPSQPTLPVPQTGVGALIGRINNGAPFMIGAGGVVSMPANGRLFIGVNDNELSDNSGSYMVTIR
jgi:small nuclear ribonucleoprotein (snRNP)-like protein